MSKDEKDKMEKRLQDFLQSACDKLKAGLENHQEDANGYRINLEKNDNLMTRYGKFIDMMVEASVGSMSLRNRISGDRDTYTNGGYSVKISTLKNPLLWFCVKNLKKNQKLWGTDLFRVNGNNPAYLWRLSRYDASNAIWGCFSDNDFELLSIEDLQKKQSFIIQLVTMLSFGYILCLSQKLGNSGGKLKLEQVNVLLSESFYDPRMASGEKVPCIEWTEERRKKLLRWYCEDFKIELPCPPVKCYYCGEQRPDNDKDCPHCHFPRKEGAKCPDCKAEVRASKGKTCCEYCGYPFADGTEWLEKLDGTKVLPEQLELCKEILLKFGKWKKIQERRKQLEADIEAQRKRREAEAEKRRKERETAIFAAKKRYEEAILARNWTLAEKIAKERADLGDGTINEWQEEIKKCQNKRKETLECACKKALKEFDDAFPANLDALQLALSNASKALEVLKNEFKNSSVISTTQKEIETRLSKFTKEKSNRLIEGLHKVEAIQAEGSKDGQPIVTLSWTPASSGTKADKWRVMRREKGIDSKCREMAVVDKPMYTDKSDSLKIGVEYEYGIIPLAEIEVSPGHRELVANEKATVWSPSVICVAKLAEDALQGSGEGEEGKWGLITLRWHLPSGLDLGFSNMKLTLTRDKTIILNDATKYNGYWEDKNVSVGKVYDYTLSLELLGKPMGMSQKRINVEKLQPPPQLSDLKLKHSASGALEAQWNWPSGVDSCIWGTSERAPKSIDDLAITKRYRLQRPQYCKSIVTLPPTNEGEQWLSVFGVRGGNGHEILSAPIVLCISKTILRYQIIGGRVFGGFWKKITPHLFVESSTGFFPEFEIRVGELYDVLSREGRIMSNPTWSPMEKQENGWWKKTCSLEGVAKKHEYIKLFLKNPEEYNCNISPEKCEVR